MTDDGHDTNITFAASWTRKWLTPLLNNSYFMDDTLVLVTFDENEDYTIQNSKTTFPFHLAVHEAYLVT